MEPTTYGFIGVGRMGALMSARLLEAGHNVVAFDVSREAMDAAKKAGAQLAGSPAEVCNLAEVVYLSLPNPEIVRQASLGRGGVIEGKKVRRVVDFSTIGPRMASAVATTSSTSALAPASAAGLWSPRARWPTWRGIPNR